jgi:hypothetical protein
MVNIPESVGHFHRGPNEYFLLQIFSYPKLHQLHNSIQSYTDNNNKYYDEPTCGSSARLYEIYNRLNAYWQYQTQ